MLLTRLVEKSHCYTQASHYIVQRYVLNPGIYLAPTAEYYQIFPGQAEFASNNTFQSSPTSKWLPAQVELV